MHHETTSIERTIAVSFAHRIYFTRSFSRRRIDCSRSFFPRPRRSSSSTRAVARAFPALADQVASYFSSESCPAKLVGAPLRLPGGEDAKNTSDLVDEVHRQIERHGICRHSYLIAIGGGALLDAAGFAAATAHRGVRHLRIPTTTLSQADGGVGVKNGINAFGKKNFIGTFAPPSPSSMTAISWGFLPIEKRAG